MILDNKLGITDAVELARVEERLSKARAYKLFSSNFLGALPVGGFEALASIHQYLFEEIYDFAGKVRTENIAKGNFRFAPVMYLEGFAKSETGRLFSIRADKQAKITRLNLAVRI